MVGAPVVHLVPMTTDELTEEVRRLPNLKLRSIVRHHRLAAGLTQEQLAQKSGLSYGYLGKLESGSRSLGPRALGKLGRILGDGFVREVLDVVSDDDD